MAELITFDYNNEKIIVDHRLFTEVLNYKGKQRDSYMRFLRDTLPRFILKQRESKPDFCFLMASHHTKKLEELKGHDVKLDETLMKYFSAQAKFIRIFVSDSLLTPEQIEKVDLTLKEEQAYYVKLMKLIETGYNNVVFKQMLLTGPQHAKQCADGVVDAGLTRVGSFDAEMMYIEYKIVEPQEGEKIFIDNQELTLGENMSTGGEAKLFYLKEDADKNLIAKIYSTTVTQDLPNCVKFQYLMRQREKKLDILFNDSRYNGILENESQIIFPIRPIYDANENLIGVLMQNVKDEDGKVYQLHSIIKNKQYPYAGFDRLDLIEIAMQIIKIMRKLHNSNIIIGDINLRNFLVTGNSKETLKVFAIDLDGCQIPKFPSYYETVGYRDPLWNIEDKLPRTTENEIYAMLILIFEILHFVHPFQYNYSKGNGTIINDFQLNMQNRDFPYANGFKDKEKDKNKGITKSPPTNANYIFSHLCSPLKDLFVKTFGEYNGEINYRPKIDEVMSLMKRYKRFVENDLQGSNCLEFDTFAISPKNRATFKCSHKDCETEHTYVHIRQLLKMLNQKSKNPNYIASQLYCGKHVQWYNNIQSFERKYSHDTESLKEFKASWESKVFDNDLVEIAERFFEKNPNHIDLGKWQEIKNTLEKSNRPNRTANYRTPKPPVQKAKPVTRQAQAPEPPKQPVVRQRAQPVSAKASLWQNFITKIIKN